MKATPAPQYQSSNRRIFAFTKIGTALSIGINYVKSRLLGVPLPDKQGSLGIFISEAEDQEEVETAVNCSDPVGMDIVPDPVSAAVSCVIRSHVYQSHDNHRSHSVNTLYAFGHVHEQWKARGKRALNRCKADIHQHILPLISERGIRHGDSWSRQVASYF